MDQNKNNLSRSINLVLTPTIYFFNFLDYTDAASIAFISMIFYYNLVSSMWRLCFFSVLAVYTRQNNIIWIGYLLLYRIITDYEVSIGSIKGNIFISTINFIKIVFNNKIDIVKKNFLQILIFPLFILYLYQYNNGSLVFGDKVNHEFSFHPTQLLYLSLFIAINLPISYADYY